MNDDPNSSATLHRTRNNCIPYTLVFGGPERPRPRHRRVTCTFVERISVGAGSLFSGAGCTATSCSFSRCSTSRNNTGTSGTGDTRSGCRCG